MTAKLWLDALNTLLETFKNIIDIRKGIEELRAKGVPNEAIAGLEEHANGRMKTTIKKTVDEVLNANGQVTKRRTELAVELEGSLTQIAIRMDNGFNFEVKSEPFEQEANDQEADEGLAIKQEALKAVKVGSSKLQFLKMEGRPILALAPPPETEREPEKKSNTKARKPRGRPKAAKAQGSS